MKLSRGSVLTAVLFVAFAAPVTAYAVSGDDADDPAGPPATHGPPSPGPSPKAHGPEHATGPERAAAASAAGRAHAEAMHAWARCVADAASGPKVQGAPIPPKLACGEKPLGPGRAEHAPPGAAPGNSGGHEPRSGHGRGHTR